MGTRGWLPSDQTPEAKAAVAAYVIRCREAGRMTHPHDPEFLRCLDKADIISRYGLLLSQTERAERETHEFYERELRRLRETVAKAGAWWDHCLRLRHARRKTARLADMGLDG